jgi:hypothetical protein
MPPIVFIAIVFPWARRILAEMSAARNPWNAG